MPEQTKEERIRAAVKEVYGRIGAALDDFEASDDYQEARTELKAVGERMAELYEQEGLVFNALTAKLPLIEVHFMLRDIGSPNVRGEQETIEMIRTVLARG